MTVTPTLAALATALSAAQGELTDATKASKNPHFNSKYADLAEILQTARPVLSKHGLAVVQTVGAYDKAGGTVQVTTMLLHKSGEYIQDSVYMPVSKPDAQGIGSATTYARRYGAAAIIGIAQDDDDAEAAVSRGAVHAEPKATKAKGKGKADAPPPAEPMTRDQLEAAFAAAKDGTELSALAPHFASLPAPDQTAALPALKAARARLGV